jgi:hypothetical protein
MNFVAGNSKKLQKLPLEGKIQLSSQCVNIAEFRHFQNNFENGKNKECAFLWPTFTEVISSLYLL